MTRLGALSAFHGRGRDARSAAAPISPPTYRNVETNIPDLFALWTLGETSGSTATDIIGARNGTYVGAVTLGFQALPTGAADAAALFGGVSYVSIPHSSGLALAAFTLSFWLQYQQKGAEPTSFVLFSKDDPAARTAGDCQVTLVETDNSIRVRFQDGVNNHIISSAPGSVQENAHHHICIRADSSGFDLSIDAKRVEKNTLYTGGMAGNAQPILLNADAVDTSLNANVVLDEVALYSRAISDSELASLAQRSAAPTAVNDAINAPEETTTTIDVTANDSFVGAKSGLTVAILDDSEVVTGGHSVSVDANNDIEFVAGTVVANEVVSFTYRITDLNGNSNTATVTVTVVNTPASTPTDLPFFGQYYGGGWPNFANGETNLNTLAGKSWFFYAERTGTIDGIQIAWRWSNPTGSGADTGYSQGAGGIYTIEVVEANATTKLPSGSVICSISGITHGNPTGGGQAYREYDFTTPGEVTVGQPYCVRIRNTRSNPSTNFESVNCVRQVVWFSENPPNFTEPAGGGAVGSIVVASGGIRGHTVGASIARVVGYSPHSIDLGGTPFQQYPVPLISNSNLTGLTCRRFGGGMMALRYDDGVYTLWGRGGGSANIVSDGYQFNLTGSNQLRQRFKVTRATRTVSGVFIQAFANGTSGNLLVRLESGPDTDSHTAGNGTLVGTEISVPASNFLNIGATWIHNQVQSGGDTAALDLPHYVWVPFAANRTLTLGSIYNLRLVPSGCNLHIVGGARGDDSYGANGRNTATWAAWEANRRISWTCFEDSRSPQVSTNGGSTWSYGPGPSRQVPITFKCVTS